MQNTAPFAGRPYRAGGRERISERPMTVTEMARMGGVARAKAHSKAELRKWGERGGRPAKLGRKGLSHLKRLLAVGRNQAECASVLGV